MKNATRAWLLPLLLAPPAVGYLVGWLVGASETPVVATLIPLVFGLLAALGYPIASKSMKSAGFAAQLMGLPVIHGLPDSAKAELRVQLCAISPPATWLPTFSGLGILAFSMCCFFGLQAGIERRVPVYTHLSDFPALNNADPEPSAEELAHLYRLRWQLNSAGVPNREFDAMINDIIAPLFGDRKDPKRGELVAKAVSSLLDDQPDWKTGLPNWLSPISHGPGGPITVTIGPYGDKTATEEQKPH